MAILGRSKILFLRVSDTEKQLNNLSNVLQVKWMQSQTSHCFKSPNRNANFKASLINPYEIILKLCIKIKH